MAESKENGSFDLELLLTEILKKDGPDLAESDIQRIARMIQCGIDRKDPSIPLAIFQLGKEFGRKKDQPYWKCLFRLLLIAGLLEGQEVVLRIGSTSSTYVVTKIGKIEKDTFSINGRSFSFRDVQSVLPVEYRDFVFHEREAYLFEATFTVRENPHTGEAITETRSANARSKMEAIWFLSSMYSRQFFNDCFIKNCRPIEGPIGQTSLDIIQNTKIAVTPKEG